MLLDALDLRPVLNLLLVLVPDPVHLLRQVIGSVVLLVVAWCVSRWIGAAVRRALARTRTDVNIIRLCQRLTTVGVMLLAILGVLGIFNVNFAALAAVIGVATLALSLSLQDLLKNFVAGIYLLVERPFRIGDRIKLKDYVGVVEDVTLRTTVLYTDDGIRIIVPNATLFGEVVSNAGEASFPAPPYVPLASILTDQPAPLEKTQDKS